MQICIDGICANKFKNMSVSTYSYEFLKRIFQLYPQPKYHLIWENDDCCEKLDLTNKTKLVDLDINRKINDYGNLEKYIIDNKINIYHSINNGLSIPKNKECKYISTIYDLYAVIDPKNVYRGYLNKFKEVFDYTIKNCDVFIATSELIKNQLVNQFNICENRIKVIYPGCSEIFEKKDLELSSEILKNKYNITTDFIMYVGSIHPRKNLDTLIEAFYNIKKSIEEIKLVIIGKTSGKRNEHYLKLINIISKFKLQDSIIFLEEVEYEDMPYFYSGARCVLSLSDYEGFPLALVEALACGAEVIYNDNEIFKEVIGCNGLMVDKNNMKSIIDTTTKVIFQKKGDIKYDEYLWSRNILETIRIYESLII